MRESYQKKMGKLSEEERYVNKETGWVQRRVIMLQICYFYSRVTDAIQEKDGWVDCVNLDL